MSDWKITATTSFCRDLNREVTLLVYGDGKIDCTGKPKSGDNKIKEKPMKQLQFKCIYPSNCLLVRYSQGLFSSESMN